MTLPFGITRTFKLAVVFNVSPILNLGVAFTIGVTAICPHAGAIWFHNWSIKVFDAVGLAAKYASCTSVIILPFNCARYCLPVLPVSLIDRALTISANAIFLSWELAEYNPFKTELKSLFEIPDHCLAKTPTSAVVALAERPNTVGSPPLYWPAI